MKKQFKTLIAAVVLSTLVAQGQTSFAANGITNGVAKSNSTELVDFLNTKGKKISKKNAQDIRLYLSVMDLYYNAPAGFYNLGEETQRNFAKASNNLAESLNSSRKKGAKAWASNVELNQSVFEFIWDGKKAIDNGTIATEIVTANQSVTL